MIVSRIESDIRIIDEEGLLKQYLHRKLQLSPTGLISPMTGSDGGSWLEADSSL